MNPAIRILVALPLICCAQERPVLDPGSYNQWKQALKATTVTGETEIRALPGFKVELVRAARPDEGSWVALAFDDQGRVSVAREDRGLLRLPADGGAAEAIESTVEEARGLVFRDGVIFANANNGRALVRLRDVDGDGKFESRETLRATTGGVGHGRNQIVFGRDDALWLIHGDDVKLPAEWTEHSIWNEDRPFSSAWDKFHWSNSVTPPAGHLVRSDAAGRLWDVWCGGLRNPFGLAIDDEGEMFTYDADMEWDVGLPWYRPTRILHLVSGADFGWRGASRAMPAWLPDTWQSVCDIGKGSPTAVVFGRGAKFPGRYQRALYALDWAYGIIYAVHLTPKGAGWTGEPEVFLQGRPLNVTGVAIGGDGAMYFTTGGRRTTSGLYRVTWAGPLPEEKPFAADPVATAARRMRREIEAFHRPAEGAIEKAWPHLASDDPLIRRAARVAVENQPGAQWISRALESAGRGGNSGVEAMLAIARAGTASDQSALLKTVAALRWKELTVEQRATALRAAQVSIIRHGGGIEIRDAVEAIVPTGERDADHLGIELLVALKSPRALGKGFALARSATTQEERLHYLFTLRHVQVGWTLEQRREWIELTGLEMRRATGAHHLAVSFRYAVADFSSGLSPEERTALETALANLNPAAAAAPGIAAPVARAFVREWTMDSAVPLLAGIGDAKRDVARGKSLFQTSCAVCHRFGAEGGAIGPDLTGISRRFDRRTILESVIEPWRVVADPYRYASATLTGGEIIAGRVLAENEKGLQVEPNPIEPGVTRAIPKDSKVTSLMPPGLINTMTADEWLDLLAWMERGGGK